MSLWGRLSKSSYTPVVIFKKIETRTNVLQESLGSSETHYDYLLFEVGVYRDNLPYLSMVFSRSPELQRDLLSEFEDLTDTQIVQMIEGYDPH